MIERIFPAPATPGPASDEDLLAWYFQDRVEGTWVSFNFVASVDGAATVAGRSGSLGNAVDQHVFQLLRRHADVILVGAQTIRAEGYGGELLGPEARQWRRDRGLAAHPPLAIVSGSLNLDPGHEVFTRAPVRPLIITTAAAPADRRAALSGVAEVIDAGTDALDVTVLIDELARRGLTRIHSEGGPTLLGTFQAADRVDELCLTVSPLLAGGTAKRIADVLPGARPAGGLAPRPMTLAHILKADSMLFLRYLRAR
ncbi:pyrimidine reductase family protein [Specibacter sp. RAF43]|uniref:pyrimidine reductase family protein n=1 Tax=Specibacter sp. RAF43 TaxID=3233057 RepID=UPI003F96B361